MSIFVIAVYVLSSISRPGPTQLTTSVRSPSGESSPIQPGAVAGSVAGTELTDSHRGALYTLAYWSETLDSWLPVSLNPDNSADHEDQIVPLMLRIESASPDSTYTFNVRHDCAHRGSYELLASYDGDGGATPTLYDEGPGSSIPDALLTGEGGNFNLWGGSFTSAEAVPSAVDLCLPPRGAEADEAYTIALAARSETVYLLWHGQAASPHD